jgi:hypothetical protein
VEGSSTLTPALLHWCSLPHSSNFRQHYPSAAAAAAAADAAVLLLQIIAFCLYSAPLYYMCEKALRVHTKPIYIRVLARLPVCEC